MSSLKNLCLSLIAREFERFHSAFVASSDETLQQDLEFLQRMYSAELACELFRKEKLKDDYLEFVINKHLKFLNEKWLANSRYENFMKDAFCRLPNLTKVICYRYSDEILENLAKFCPKIIEIDASFITDQGVKYLCGNDNGKSPCPELKEISVRSIDFRLTHEGMELILRNIKSLERLRHRNVALTLYCIHREHLPDFKKMPRCNLIELNISEDDTLPYYKDLFKISLTVCPKLRYLTCCISDKEQLNFFNNPCLEELILSFRRTCEKINIDSFLKNCGRSLVIFRVYNCLLSFSGIAAGCPNLRCLVLDDVTLLDDHGDEKTVFHSLVNCTFCQTKDKSISDRAMNLFLLSSPNLRDVKFIHRDLTPDMKNSILKCCKKCLLTSISFMVCTRLEKDFVQEILVNCPSLKTLEIWDCPFAGRKQLLEFAETLSNKPRFVLFDKR